MNKTELATTLAQRTELTRNQARDAVDNIFDPVNGIVAEALAAGERVAVAGFGTFEVRERAARTGRNPRTGEALQIAARRYPAFKAAAGLKGKLD